MDWKACTPALTSTNLNVDVPVVRTCEMNQGALLPGFGVLVLGCYLTAPIYDNKPDISFAYKSCSRGCLHGVVYTVDFPTCPFFYRIRSVCWDPATRTAAWGQSLFADCAKYRPSPQAEVDVYLEAKKTACFTSKSHMALSLLSQRVVYLYKEVFGQVFVGMIVICHTSQRIVPHALAGIRLSSLLFLYQLGILVPWASGIWACRLHLYIQTEQPDTRSDHHAI